MRRPLTEEWSPFGSHWHRFEPPDLYFSRVNGDISGEDMLTQIDAMQKLAERLGHPIVCLSDVRNMRVFSPQARQAAAGMSATEMPAALRASAVFGAAFTTRVMVSLLVRAVGVLNPKTIRPLAFVETEAEARAFLDKHRNG